MVEPQQWRFDGERAEPLLDSARKAGVLLPKSCRNGTCRSCICLLRTGSVHYRIEWPGLSAQEKAEGYILPCVAYPDTDVVIVSPDAKRQDIQRNGQRDA